MFRGQRLRLFLIIVCELYHYTSYMYLLEGAISYVQMCELYNSRVTHFDGVASTGFPRILEYLIFFS